MKKIITLTIFIFVIIIFSLIIIKKKTIKQDNKIVVAEVTHSVFYAPWYVALDKNYFKNEGLNIEIILTPGADKVATSVISGDANIGLSGPEATIYVYNNSRKKLLTFASLTKRDGQFIVGDCKYKGIFNMEALIGKTVLAGRSAGMPLMMFEYAFILEFSSNFLVVSSDKNLCTFFTVVAYFVSISILAELCVSKYDFAISNGNK